MESSESDLGSVARRVCVTMGGIRLKTKNEACPAKPPQTVWIFHATQKESSPQLSATKGFKKYPRLESNHRQRV